MKDSMLQSKIKDLEKLLEKKSSHSASFSQTISSVVD